MPPKKEKKFEYDKKLHWKCLSSKQMLSFKALAEICTTILEKNKVFQET